MEAVDKLGQAWAEQVFGEFLAWVECQPACEAADWLARVAAGQGFVEMAACFVGMGETVRWLSGSRT